LALTSYPTSSRQDRYHGEEDSNDNTDNEDGDRQKFQMKFENGNTSHRTRETPLNNVSVMACRNSSPSDDSRLLRRSVMDAKRDISPGTIVDVSSSSSFAATRPSHYKSIDEDDRLHPALPLLQNGLGVSLNGDSPSGPTSLSYGPPGSSETEMIHSRAPGLHQYRSSPASQHDNSRGHIADLASTMRQQLPPAYQLMASSSYARLDSHHQRHPQHALWPPPLSGTPVKVERDDNNIDDDMLQTKTFQELDSWSTAINNTNNNIHSALTTVYRTPAVSSSSYGTPTVPSSTEVDSYVDVLPWLRYCVPEAGER